MSASVEHDDPNEHPDKVNMVPLIDCMFFLILFFLIVTKFTPDELAIASILPTDKGQLGTPPPSNVPPVQVNIAIYPADMHKGHSEREYGAIYDAQVAAGTFNKQVWLRIGGDDPLLVDGEKLSAIKYSSGEMRSEIAGFHDYVKKALEARDEAGKDRKSQVPVVISCFSGLSWKYAILAYDAVRAFEATKTGGKYNKTTFDMLQAREVSFAPPRIRNFKVTVAGETGAELWEIVQLK